MRCDTHFCGSAVSAGLLAGFACFFQPCNLESKWEVGGRAVPWARVAPRHHRSVDLPDCDLVRFHCERTARSAQERPWKESICSQKRPTYVWQEEVPGIVLHQEVFGAHVDGDLDGLALLSVRAVLLNPAPDPAVAVVHWARDLAPTRGAGPVSPTGIHWADRKAVILRSAGEGNVCQGLRPFKGGLRESSTYRWAVTSATLPARLVCQDQEHTNSPSKFFAEQLKYSPGNRTQTNRDAFISWKVYFLMMWSNIGPPWSFFRRIFLLSLTSLIRTTV